MLTLIATCFECYRKDGGKFEELSLTEYSRACVSTSSKRAIILKQKFEIDYQQRAKCLRKESVEVQDESLSQRRIDKQPLTSHGLSMGT